MQHHTDDTMGGVHGVVFALGEVPALQPGNRIRVLTCTLSVIIAFRPICAARPAWLKPPLNPLPSTTRKMATVEMPGRSGTPTESPFR